MILEYLNWRKAAAMVTTALGQTILDKTITYDLERQMPGATRVSTSQFATKIIENMR